MKSFGEFLLRPIKNALNSFKRFTVALIYVFVFFIILFFLVQFENINEKLSTTLILSSAFGILLNLVLVCALERSKRVLKNWQFYMLGGIIAPLFMFLILNLLTLDDMLKARVIVILFSLFVAFFIIPTLKSEKFNFNNNVLIGLKGAFIAFFYGLVLMLGLFFLAFSIKQLLFKELSEKVFSHITVFSGMIATIFFIGYFPPFDDDIEEPHFLISSKVTLFIEVLISYIVIPVLTAFTLVFLGYAAKIIALWNWPSNQFALYSALYCLAGIAIYILSSNIENSFSKFFRMWFPKLLILVLGLQSISIYLRVAAYGLTEKRYFLILFFVFCVFCGIWFNIRDIKRNKLVAVFAISLAILSVLPIVNYSEASGFTQVIRAEQILNKYDMLKGGRIIQNSSVSKDDQKKLTDILLYLNNGNRYYLAPFLPKNFDLKQASEVFGFSVTDISEPSMNKYYSFTLSQNSYSLNGYNMAVITTKDYYEYGSIDKASFKGKNGNYEFEIKNTQNGEVLVVLKLSEREIINKKLDDFITALKNEYSVSNEKNGDMISKEQNFKLPFSKMSATFDSNNCSIMLVFKNFSINEVSNAKSIYDYTFDLYIGEK